MARWNNRTAGLVAGGVMIVLAAAVGLLWLATPGGLQAAHSVSLVVAAMLGLVFLVGAAILIRAWRGENLR
jgi:hypothetical protein